MGIGAVKSYRKKPVVIEAIQVSWANWGQICEFVSDGSLGSGVYLDDAGNEIEAGANVVPNMIGVFIRTLEGTMLAREGDYIIKGIRGEFYPCKPEIFVATYEEVRED